MLLNKKITNLSLSLSLPVCLSACRLGDNYEMVSGSCLPRSVLYTHYQDFCKKNQVEASSAASFGKVSYIYASVDVHNTYRLSVAIYIQCHVYTMMKL